MAASESSSISLYPPIAATSSYFRLSRQILDFLLSISSNRVEFTVQAESSAGLVVLRCPRQCFEFLQLEGDIGCYRH